jgi:hypothetical protein
MKNEIFLIIKINLKFFLYFRIKILKMIFLRKQKKVKFIIIDQRI